VRKSVLDYYHEKENIEMDEKMNQSSDNPMFDRYSKNKVEKKSL
jgi:hypothetical protein